MNQLELEARHSSRKSFYGKARVEAMYPIVKLWSYETHVATVIYDPLSDAGETKSAEIYGTYSNTTLRHIKEFLLQYGFKAENKDQMVKDYLKESR